MALDTKNEPLQFLATDNDYTMTGVKQKLCSNSQHPHDLADLLSLFSKGLNPNINYFVNGRSDFTIIEGYLFMTRSLSEGTLNLQVRSRVSQAMYLVND